MTQSSSRRRIASGGRVALAVATAVTLAACGSSASSSPSTTSGGYPIGIVSDLTGPIGALGSAFADGAQAYFKSIDYTVDGHRLKVEQPIDTRSDAGAAQAGFRQAVGEHPIAMVGLSISSSVVGSESILDSAGIPLIDATTLPQLNGDGSAAPKKWFFTIGAAGNQVVDGMVFKLGQLAGGLKGKRFAIARSASAAVEADAAVIKARAADQGFQVVDDETMPTGSASFTSQAANIARTHPDGVLLLGIANDAVTIAKALADAGVTTVPLLQFNGGTTFALMKAVNLPNYYATFDSPEPVDGSALVKTASRLGLAQNVHSANFSQGWAAAAVVAQAIKVCGADCTAASMTSAIEKVTDFTPPDGASFGPIDLSPTDHICGATITVFKWDPAGATAVPAGAAVHLPAFG